MIRTCLSIYQNGINNFTMDIGRNYLLAQICSEGLSALAYLCRNKSLPQIVFLHIASTSYYNIMSKKFDFDDNESERTDTPLQKALLHICARPKVFEKSKIRSSIVLCFTNILLIVLQFRYQKYCLFRLCCRWKVRKPFYQ